MNDKLFNGYGYVYEVYKTRSFSKAAENLFISQSSLSATIRKIEQRIGVDIFDRSTVPIGLTEEGAEYIKAVEKIMDIENYFTSRVQRLEELVDGHLAIGGSSIYVSHVMVPVLEKFTRHYPGVQLRFVEGGSRQLEKLLSEGYLDMVVDNRQLSEEHYAQIPLIEDGLLLAVPRDWPINQTLTKYQMTLEDILNKKHLSDDIPVVPLDKFGELPFLLLRSGNDTRNRADRLFFRYGLSPLVTIKADQQASALNLASHGLAITFISDCVVHSMQSDRVLYYRLPPEDVRRQVSIFYRKNHLQNRCMQEFLKTVEETVL